MPCNAFFMYLEHFFKVPFSDPLWSPKQRKKGHLQKPAKICNKTRNKNKGYNANNTSTHLPPLELMPRNAFLMYLEHFFKVPFSDPFHNQSKEKRGTCKNPAKRLKKQKKTKTKGYNANNTSAVTTFRAHALQCLLHVFGAFFQGALFWPPLIT